jgi:thiol-disulfide isomerase/thioredoxin
MKLTRPLPLVLIALALVAAVGMAWRSIIAREPAPSVSYTLLDGSKASTEAMKGKVFLVNFWATSCTTCVAEMPQIVATHEKFRARGFETLAVTAISFTCYLDKFYIWNRKLFAQIFRFKRC